MSLKRKKGEKSCPVIASWCPVVLPSTCCEGAGVITLWQDDFFYPAASPIGPATSAVRPGAEDWPFGGIAVPSVQGVQ